MPCTPCDMLKVLSPYDKESRLSSVFSGACYLPESLLLEMIVTVNEDCGYRQSESDVLSAVSAWWEGVVVHTSDLVSVLVSAIVDYIVNTRIGYSFSRPERVSNVSHFKRCSFLRKNQIHSIGELRIISR
jgi:hypothetical protein